MATTRGQGRQKPASTRKAAAKRATPEADAGSGRQRNVEATPGFEQTFAGAMSGALPGMQASETGAQQFVDTMKRNMQMLLQIAGATLEGADRIRRIQMAAAKSAQSKTTSMQQSFGKVGAPNEAWTVEQKLLLENVQQAIAYWNEMLEAAAATNAAIAKILSTGFTGYTDQGTRVAREMEKAFEAFAPGKASGSDWMPAVSAANAAYRNLWENTGRMIDQLRGNLQAMTVAAGTMGRKGGSEGGG